MQIYAKEHSESNYTVFDNNANVSIHPGTMDLWCHVSSILPDVLKVSWRFNFYGLHWPYKDSMSISTNTSGISFDYDSYIMNQIIPSCMRVTCIATKAPNHRQIKRSIVNINMSGIYNISIKVNYTGKK